MNSFWMGAWEFINSPVGISLLVYLLGKLWKRKPAWERMFDRHRGLFFDAIREAEKLHQEKASSQTKMQLALSYLHKLELPLFFKGTEPMVLGLEKALEIKKAEVVKEWEEGE